MLKAISDGVKHPLADCSNCTLNNSEAKFCPSLGPEIAEIVIVGEAPGHQEARQRIPFVGAAGKLLNTLLQGNGINQDEVFVTNVCLCHPPDNRQPTKLEIACCAERLKTEIESRKPRAIVALGNTVASAIMGEKVAITKLRQGGPKESRLYPGVDIIPTFHPAYILRYGEAFPSLAEDIAKLNSSGTFIKWQEPKYIVVDNNVSQEVIRQIKAKHKELVIDIEVGLDRDTDFDHPNHYKMLCIGIGYAPNRAAIFPAEVLRNRHTVEALKDLFESSKLIAHNGKFDLKGLMPLIGLQKLYFDTMLASYLLDERRGTNGLKYLASELLGAPDYSADIKQYVGRGQSYENIPKELLYKYNAYDVSCTFSLYEIYKEKLEKENLRRTHDFLVSASNALMQCELAGIAIDKDYMEFLKQDFKNRMRTLERDLYKWVDNPRSPLQVKKALAELDINTESTEEKILRQLLFKAKGSAKEFLTQLLIYRRTAKLYSTYIKGIDERIYNGKIYPTFLLHGTTTGRLACRNPNLQNVPRENTIRKLFIPPEGKVFIQADYAAIELRVVATLARDAYLRDVFISGRDIHSEVATKFFGPSFTKDQRVRAKAVVFGLVYGREAYSLAQEFKIPTKEAERYMHDFFELIPQVVEWRKSIEYTILHTQDDLISPFGRHRRFWLVSDDNKRDIVKEGLAFLPQSTASDITLSAMIEMQKEGIKTILPVHDSILVEALEDEAEDIAIRMTTIMQETAARVFDTFVPFKAEVNIGKNWSEV